MFSSCSTEIKIQPKKYILLADSYDWVSDIYKNEPSFENKSYNFQKSGSGFSYYYTFIDILKSRENEIFNSLDIEYIYIFAGANDWNALRKGVVTKYDIINSINDFCNYCNTKYPNANIYIGFIGWLNLKDAHKFYDDALQAYKENENNDYIYIKNSEYIITSDLIADDRIHPNIQGHIKMGNVIADIVINHKIVFNQ